MLSVIVCTHNRCTRLTQTLDSFARVQVPANLLWELIIVDNNSTDKTEEAATSFLNTSGLNARYFLEPHQGLSHARNRGINEARGEILAYTDDDCIVAEDWISAINGEFARDRSLSALGGSVMLYDKNDRSHRTKLYQERVTFTSLRQLFKLIPGSNMAFARRVFDTVGGFDPTLGAGTRFSSAEDSDFLYRAFRAGFKIVHSPHVVVYHNHGRRTLTQIQTLSRGYALGRGAFYCKHIAQGDREILRLAWREIFKKTKRLVRHLAARHDVSHQARLLLKLLVGMGGKAASLLRSKCELSLKGIMTRFSDVFPHQGYRDRIKPPPR